MPSKVNPLPPASELAKHFLYDPESGLVYYVTPGKGRRADRPAGSLNPVSKRHYLFFEGTKYARSRVAWVLMTGQDPGCDREIDHVNGDPSDDRWANLRSLTRSENLMARRAYGKSGLKNITLYRRKNGTVAYRARVCYGGESHYLGTFEHEEEATLAVAEHYREQGLLMYQSPRVRQRLAPTKPVVVEKEVA